MSEEAGDGIRVAVLIGTVRPGNYTSKALALVTDEIERKGVALEQLVREELARRAA